NAQEITAFFERNDSGGRAATEGIENPVARRCRTANHWPQQGLPPLHWERGMRSLSPAFNLGRIHTSSVSLQPRVVNAFASAALRLTAWSRPSEWKTNRSTDFVLCSGCGMAERKRCDEPSPDGS